MKRKTTTLTKPTPTFVPRTLPSTKAVYRWFRKAQNSVNGSISGLGETVRQKKNRKFIIPLALLVIVIGGIAVYVGRTLHSASSMQSTDKITIKGPIAQQDINREFSFPIMGSDGKEVTKLKYTIEKAELRDEIIVKGTRATTVEGRVFLIVTLRITNDFDKAINVNSRDYLRLSVNGNETELLAADVHNDPVNVQAISAKSTRVGFPINTSDTNLVLKVGEIKGDKESITLSF